MTVRTESVVLNEPLVIALARARALGQSAYKVAVAADVNPSELSRWANGHKLPTRTQAEQVASVLGYPVDQLFPRTRRAGDPPINESSPAARPGSTKATGAGRHEQV